VKLAFERSPSGSSVVGAKQSHADESSESESSHGCEFILEYH
jgi:hypothetical protein